MADKQIIIDGVDVSGCEHFSVYSNNGCNAYFLENEDTVVGCENYPNCYYKQLKRKEGIINILEQECTEKMDIITTLGNKLKAKEQECEMLKEGLNLILTVQKNCKECPHQKLDVDVLVCDLDCATAFKKIAKQTLKKLENKNV